jgi:hypothetical protein
VLAEEFAKEKKEYRTYSTAVLDSNSCLYALGLADAITLGFVVPILNEATSDMLA